MLVLWLRQSSLLLASHESIDARRPGSEPRQWPEVVAWPVFGREHESLQPWRERLDLVVRYDEGMRARWFVIRAIVSAVAVVAATAAVGSAIVGWIRQREANSYLGGIERGIKAMTPD